MTDEPEKPARSGQANAEIGKRLANAYQPIQVGQAYAEIGKRLAENFKPLQIRTEFGLGDAFKRLSETVTAYQKTWTASITRFQSVFRDVFGDAEKLGRLEPTGWLPHSTTPLHLLEDEVATADLRDQVEQHYVDSWPEIKADFATRVALYDLDDEAQEAFLEALSAHETGHYRSVVRLLFPEFERIAGKEFYQGKFYEKPREGETQGKQITSLSGFRDAIGDLPLSDVVGFDYGFQLYKKLDDHLYKAVGSSPSRIRRCENDPVPNRNASLHGIVSYRSFQNSMNMIIMADYVYHLFSVMKLYLIEEASDDVDRTEIAGGSNS